MSKLKMNNVVAIFIILLLPACSAIKKTDQPFKKKAMWLAGDHHIHSEWSGGWRHKGVNDKGRKAPTHLKGGDAIYSTNKNAQMATKFGLDWMVSTDHGGPNHSKVNLQFAYPEILKARNNVPEILIFYGMEFNSPSADHSSLIMPHSDHEAQNLYDFQRSYGRLEAYPYDPKRDHEAAMHAAVKAMKKQSPPPVLIANHPSRRKKNGVYKTSPREMRDWNDIAPNIVVGMEGAPGHQAMIFQPDGSIVSQAARGDSPNVSLLGGYDPMTAKLGGFWDSMLGEGRRWWVTATSDSHRHWHDGGNDFWPGEYAKTYVYAEKEFGSVLAAIRQGRVFVTTGDLISELYVTAKVVGSAKPAVHIGEELIIQPNDTVKVSIRFLDPKTNNANGQNPKVSRVDLIGGKIFGMARDRKLEHNPSTKVLSRAYGKDWVRDGDYWRYDYVIKNIQQDRYIRVRGTNTSEMEPAVDPLGENPWLDLWFYANPIFIKVIRSGDM